MPYWRLSLFYFFYFAALGAFIAFWGLYLQQIGINEFGIGSLLAVFVAPRIFSPIVFAWVADKTQKLILVLQVSSILMLISFIGLVFADKLTFMFFWTFCFGFFFSGILPKFEALTFGYILNESHKYTLIRLWGSIGFTLAVLIFGWVLQQTAVDWLPYMLILLVGGIVLVSFSLQDTKVFDAKQEQSFINILFIPKVRYILLVAFLVQLSHGVYYAFFSIYLQEFSYSKDTIGFLWAIGVLSEIALFIYLSRIKLKFSYHTLIMLALVLTVLRWMLTAIIAQDWFLLSLVQLLHAASFALFHAIAVQYINAIFTRNTRARGQAVYAMASFGAGGMLGSIIAGASWDYIGGPAVFALSALAALAAAFIWHINKSKIEVKVL